jgi:hypothetical protein
MAKFSAGRSFDRFRLWLALLAHDFARRTIASVRGRRGRDFIGLECDLIDRRKGILTELDQAEERRRVPGRTAIG